MHYVKWKLRTGLMGEWSSSLSYTQAAWILFIWELTWHVGIRESHIMYNARNIP